MAIINTALNANFLKRHQMKNEEKGYEIANAVLEGE